MGAHAKCISTMVIGQLICATAISLKNETGSATENPPLASARCWGSSDDSANPESAASPGRRPLVVDTVCFPCLLRRPENYRCRTALQAQSLKIQAYVRFSDHKLPPRLTIHFPRPG